MKALHVDALKETVDRLRREVAELRASRRRLVVGADADRRGLERDLHGGVQQSLVALAVNLQLGAALVETDPAAAKSLIEEMGRDVQQALGETTHLAQRIYPTLLEPGGLAAALRSAASVGTRTSVQIAGDASCPPEVAATIYFYWLELLESGARATVNVRAEQGALAFEFLHDGGGTDAELEDLRDRVEALGGRLMISSDARHGTRVTGSLPLSR